MKKMLKLLISRFKEPVTYYIWSCFLSVLGVIINLVFPHINGYTRNLVFCGLVVMLIGVIIDLGKHRFDKVDNIELDEKINNIESEYWQNVLRNLYTFCIKYQSKDMYLCRFYRKTGTVLVVFVDNIEMAKEYMEWYLSKDNTYKNININSNRATKIHPNDIEEFEYQRVSWIQRKIMNPIYAFFKQPSFIFLPFRGILIFSILTIAGIGGYYYLSGDFLFASSGSYEIINRTISISINFVSTILILFGLSIIIIGMFSLKSAKQIYYTNKFVSRKTVFNQLVTLALVPICFNIFIQPFIIHLMKLAQNNGYFLP